MLDLGTSFVGSVARDPDSIAIVDGDLRVSYRDWYQNILSVASGLKRLGLAKGDRVMTLLQNSCEAATLYWSCQLTGLVFTPINWRATTEEVKFYLKDCSARAIVFQDVSADAVEGITALHSILRISIGIPNRQAWIDFESLLNEPTDDVSPQANTDDLSILLYTSGTTSNPKGVPRCHRTERAAAIAHIAQNLYRRNEVTLGVMPLYHTMGIRSLISMSLVGGAFISMPRFSVADALRLIELEQITNLCLVPTLFHDMAQSDGFSTTDFSSVSKLTFAGSPMTANLLDKLESVVKPEVFVNQYGSTEIYTFTYEQNAARKPGSAGKAGVNQYVRVVKMDAGSADEIASVGEEGEIIALMDGDEAFGGYWHRPDENAKAMRDGWYFTGDTGYFDDEGDLFVTGRVDDLINTGGENVSPVEIESCLSLHPLVEEAVVIGLPDERLGQIVVAIIKRCRYVGSADLEGFCRASALANYKCPRRYIFVNNIPKSPVGKILRRKIVECMRESEGKVLHSMDEEFVVTSE